MKRYIVTSEKEFFEAFREIVEVETQGLIINEKRGYSTAYIAIEDAFGSGVKEIIYKNYYRGLNADDSFRFEYGGLYYKGKFYNVSGYGFLPDVNFDDGVFYRGRDAVNEGLARYFEVGETSELVEEIPNKVFEVMTNKFKDLEALKKAGFIGHVKRAENYNWDIEELQGRIVKKENYYYTPYKYVKNLDKISLIKIDMGEKSWEDYVEELIEQYADDEDDNAYWKLAQYYSYCKAIEKAKSTMTEKQVLIQNILASIRKFNIKNEANITIHLLGRNSLLRFGNEQFPDFSIEGQDVTIKESLSSFIRNIKDDGHFEIDWNAKFTPVLKEKYANRCVRYIDDYELEDISSITYGRNVLYTKKD